MNQSLTLTAGQWNQLVNAVRAAEARFNGAPWPHVDYTPSRMALETAYDALRTAMQSAPHGSEMPPATRGGVFITKRSDDECGSVTILWINRRRVVVMERDKYIRLVDRARAKTERLAARARARAADKRYKETREQLARELVRAGVVGSTTSFGGWKYQDGQEGGYFYHLALGCVSARGVLARAAEIRLDQLEELEDELLNA